MTCMVLWITAMHSASVFKSTACILPNYLMAFCTMLTLTQTDPCFYVSTERVQGDTAGKGETARDEQIRLFPQCFFFFFFFLGEFSTIFIRFELTFCKLFQFGGVENSTFLLKHCVFFRFGELFMKFKIVVCKVF